MVNIRKNYGSTAENTAGGDIGLIQLWSGSGVPEGYVLCDGSQVFEGIVG